MSEPTFIWDNQPRPTIRDLLDAATEAQRAGRAAEFMGAYRDFTPHADANLGYVLGYVEPLERRRELYEAFGIGHPIFGGAV